MNETRVNVQRARRASYCIGTWRTSMSGGGVLGFPKLKLGVLRNMGPPVVSHKERYWSDCWGSASGRANKSTCIGRGQVVHA
jgi:hypothetical protein